MPPPPPPPLDELLDETDTGDEESEIVAGLWISRRGLIGRAEGEESGDLSRIGATLTGGARVEIDGIEVTRSASSEGGANGLIVDGGGAESSSSKLSKSSSKGG